MRKPLLVHPGVRHAKRPNCLAAGMLAMALSPALAYAAEPAKADADNKEAAKTLAPVKVIGTQGERVQGYKAETTRLGRMKQELKDVPQAVSVVTHDLMAEQGAANLKDVLKNVSGITFAAGEGGRSGDQVILRGFAAFNDMYRDGQRDVAQYNRDPFNDEKIEVLKGASSMLFGRGSTGGVINQVSKAPFAGELLGADLTIGTNHYQRITLDVNKPYSDTTAVRLNVMGTDDGSPNGKSKSKRWGVAPSVAFGLGEPTTLVLSHHHLTEKNRPDLGVPYDPNTLKPLDVPVSRYYGVDGLNMEDITTDITTARLTHKLDSQNELNAQLRHGRYDRMVLVTAPRLVGVSAGVPVTDNTQIAPGAKLRGSLNETTVFSLDYTGKFNTGILRHNMLAGVEFTHDTQSATSVLMNGTIPNMTVGNPTTSGWKGSLTVRPSNQYSSNNVAAFATDTIELTPQWKVMAGLRFDRLEGTYTSYNTSTGAITSRTKRDDRGMSYRTGLIWQPTDTQSYYAGYSTLMNPSGEAYALDKPGENVKPERNQHYEVGAKWDLLDGDLTFRTALFRTVKLNERNTDPLVPDVSILYSKRHTNGIEFEAAGRINAQWSVFAGASLMDPKIDQGYNTSANNGAVPKYTPKKTFNLWSTYKVTDTVTAGLGVYHVGKTYASDGNADQSRTNYLPAYTRLDAMLAYDTRNYAVKLNINNLTNKKYYDGQYSGHANVAPPREAQLTVSYKY